MNIGLSSDQEAYVQRHIVITNWKRIHPFLILGMVMEIGLMVFVDMPLIQHPERDVWGTSLLYLIFHTLLFLILFIGFFLSQRFLKRIDQADFQPKNTLSVVLTTLFLVCLTVISCLDQQKGDQLTVYIVSMLSIAVLVLYKPPTQYIVFSIPYLVFVVGMFMFQPDRAILMLNLVNGAIFFVITIAVAKLSYDNFYGQVGKNILLEAANQKLEFVSLHDPLTGLANRRNFEIQIEHEMQLLKRYQHHSVLVLVDLDRFKRVNDQFGHLAGDRVLQEIAEILCENIRDADLASRWGGEEFLILLSHTTLDGAYLLVERIKNVIEQHTFSVGDDGIHITASFGIAPLFIDEQNTYLSSYHLADQAMYTAKTNGRNQIVVA